MIRARLQHDDHRKSHSLEPRKTRQTGGATGYIYTHCRIPQPTYKMCGCNAYEELPPLTTVHPRRIHQMTQKTPETSILRCYNNSNTKHAHRALLIIHHTNRTLTINHHTSETRQGELTDHFCTTESNSNRIRMQHQSNPAIDMMPQEANPEITATIPTPNDENWDEN